MKKLPITLLSTALIISMLSGCGSNSGSTSAGHSSSTQDSYYSADVVAGLDSGISNSFSSSGGSSFSVDGFSKGDSYSSSESYEYEQEYIPEEASSEVAEAREENHTADMTLAEEKLVYTCTMSIETLEYEDTINKVNELIETYGGVVQQIYEYDKAYDWYYDSYVKTTGTMTCSMSIRVPSSNYKDMTESLGNIGRIKSKQASVDNISQEYYDTKTDIEMLQKEEARLLEMMENAYSIEDMLTIEERLHQVESQLNKLQTEIRYMDMDVAYSYINLDISEVMEYSEDRQPVKTNTFLDRLYNKVVDTWDGLKDNLEGLLLFFIGILPYAVIIVALVVIYKVTLSKKVKAIQKRRKEKRAQSGDLSIKDMSKIIADLNKKLDAKEEDKDDKSDIEE